MSDIKVWLIYNKASVSSVSPLNMDGSDFVVGVSVVPSSSKNEAMSLFYQDLAVNHMELLELGDVTEFQPDHYQQDTDLNRGIISAAEGAARRGVVYYVCEATSESLKY